jgi:23S rRNA pseudoU1915 N3-methylase RlmH
MDKLRLPHAIVISSVLLTLAALAALKIDNGPLIMGAIFILGSLGFVIKQGAEQGEQNRNIQTTVNGNNRELVETIKNQHADAQAAAAKQQELFMSLVTDHQKVMAAMVAENATHMRALADKLAEMVPANAVVSMVAGSQNGESNGGNGNGGNGLLPNPEGLS